MIWISIGIIPPHQEKTFSRPEISLFVRTRAPAELNGEPAVGRSASTSIRTQLLTVLPNRRMVCIGQRISGRLPIQNGSEDHPQGDIDVRNEVICVSVGAKFRCSKAI